MNAYQNQAHNVPPPRGKMSVGQKVQTLYGIGTIVDIKSTFHRGACSHLDPLIATILIPWTPENPARVIYQAYQTLVFVDSAVGGQISTQSGNSNSPL